MSAAELRAAVRAVLDQLDDGVKDSVIDTLMMRGTKTKSGWKPARHHEPSRRRCRSRKRHATSAAPIRTT
jgi:hypothetical protein